MRHRFVAFLAFLSASHAAWAGKYDYHECTDANGFAAYSVEPCPKGKRGQRIADDTAPETVDLSRSANSETLSLLADGSGSFYTAGLINGVAMRFVVDTGATFVSLGARDANRAGIKFRQGRPGISWTANGQMRAWIVTLASVSIGGVTLHNVDASVSESEHPALLGMSFLKRMTVVVDGPVMTLKTR